MKDKEVLEIVIKQIEIACNELRKQETKYTIPRLREVISQLETILLNYRNKE